MRDLKETQPLSSSTGDYLKVIRELSASGAASTTGIAARLSVSPGSVTRMLRRLQRMGLVDYERYYGASLTEVGRTEALRLVRRHRLIETFLLKCLGYSWENVHEEAERLEHVVSDEFTERLAKLLGNPKQDPHGAPIPAADGSLSPEIPLPLSEAEAGQRVRVSRVSHEDTAALAYLAENGLIPGRLLKVEKVRALDGVVTVEDEEGTSHALGEALAGSVLVRNL
jgi:DtxR family transcriptional regulator, Mn-dependent transcriptional regulator